jgi:hypothetical protein
LFHEYKQILDHGRLCLLGADQQRDGLLDRAKILERSNTIQLPCHRRVGCNLIFRRRDRQGQALGQALCAKLQLGVSVGQAGFNALPFLGRLWCAKS